MIMNAKANDLTNSLSSTGMVENLSWSNPSDDHRINKFTERVTSEIDKKLTAANQKARYQYINDAGKGQEIFQTYPPENLQKLQQIRDKYDPNRVFTDLMPGGWKVADL